MEFRKRIIYLYRNESLKYIRLLHDFFRYISSNSFKFIVVDTTKEIIDMINKEEIHSEIQILVIGSYDKNLNIYFDNKKLEVEVITYSELKNLSESHQYNKLKFAK